MYYYLFSSHRSSAIVTGDMDWAIYEYDNFQGSGVCLPASGDVTDPMFYEKIIDIAGEVSSAKPGCSQSMRRLEGRPMSSVIAAKKPWGVKCRDFVIEFKGVECLSSDNLAWPAIRVGQISLNPRLVVSKQSVIQCHETPINKVITKNNRSKV